MGFGRAGITCSMAERQSGRGTQFISPSPSAAAPQRGSLLNCSWWHRDIGDDCKRQCCEHQGYPLRACRSHDHSPAISKRNLRSVAILQRESRPGGLGNHRHQADDRLAGWPGEFFGKMPFGPLKLKPESGANHIRSADDAYSFVAHMRLSCQNKPHWQVARQALNHAGASDANEIQAWRAFRVAVKAEGWLAE